MSHYNTSLLFQFILAEFLTTFAEIKRLDALCNGPIKHLNSETSSSSYEQNMTEIKNSLKKLVGSPQDATRLFPWNLSEGLLAKLKSYYALFSQNSDSEGKELIAMQHYADKAWQACVQARDLISEKPFDKPAFAISIDKASASTQRFSKLIMRILHQFIDDENAIFFVLKNHQVLDQLYGGRYTYRLLNRLYAKGLKEAHHLLVKRYSERGFDNIVKSIHANVSQIEALVL